MTQLRERGESSRQGPAALWRTRLCCAYERRTYARRKPRWIAFGGGTAPAHECGSWPPGGLEETRLCTS